MNFLQILLLGLIQGAAELLPVSSSAHVIVAEKLMGLDPSSPEMTFVLVMLHTGTMFAVAAYFWSAWRARYFSSWAAFQRIVILVVVATAFTGVIGLALKQLLEKLFLGSDDIEEMFSNLYLIAASLAAAGVLIIVSGRHAESIASDREPDLRSSCWIGAIQGLCLPFRGFSRSGATISVGLLRNIDRVRMEEFSFALAVVLTPPVIAREVWRMLKDRHHELHPLHLTQMFAPGLLGMVCSFVAGLLALKFLSRLLESGRWTWFGYYCLAAAAGVLVLGLSGI